MTDYTKSFDDMFAESKQAQADMEEAGRKLIAKIKEINQSLRERQQYMTEEQAIEHARTNTDVISLESIIL